jgi:GntR family transcriptional regulator
MSTGPTTRSVAPLVSGPIPLYHQLRQALRDRIAAGEWRPGDQVPTIRELCRLYGVSRITAVQALGALAHEGVLARKQGKGTFVAEPKIEHGPVRLLSFTEDIARRGHLPGSRILELARIPASETIAARLQVARGDAVVLLRRLRLTDGKPMGVQNAYLPDDLFPDLADMREPIDSLYRLLDVRYGVVPTKATEAYEPIVVDDEAASLLGVRRGAPAFSVERLTRDQRNRLVEFTVSILRGDRYKVILDLAGPGL